ncbi:maleylpyruvate isomerase family mycothiol-dependent enzyme [Arthrobacter sp. GMC3]|uniref:maleylpyruvate isomerase family mycothiol-dependent enzyme n=1 Tax=Arthrobacter sp. GMC3 TaxID=2058894 RepID=UPI0011B05D0C|nr:maleylpyruvate isomerase family mycothiol-dependent enzyme [Arthrobacter sp. GMC3]
MKNVHDSPTSFHYTDRQSAAAGYVAVMTGVADLFDTFEGQDWERPTDCAGWNVRDMASHLLGAQEDLMSVPGVLGRRWTGRRRYPGLSLLDAANQVQIDSHASESTAELARSYRANIPKVARYVSRFPRMLSGISVDKTMAPRNSPLRLGYLYNVIYLRDAWMHGIDLARATGVPRPACGVEAMVVGQIMDDAAYQWGAEAGPEVVLSGEISGTWQLGRPGQPARVTAAGLDLCRRLSGRRPETEVMALSANPADVDKLAGLRILF